MSNDMKAFLITMAITPFITYFLHAFNLITALMWLIVVPLVLMGLAIITHRALSFFFGAPLPKILQNALGRRE